MTEADPDRRREVYATVALLAIGGGGLLLIANRAWLTVQVARQPPFAPLSLGVTGRHLYPALTGLALVGLLAALLVAVSGRLVRLALGVLVAIVAVWLGGYAVVFLADPGRYRTRELIGDRAGLATQAQAVSAHRGWAVAALLAAVLMLAGAGLLLMRAGRWTGGLSRRYAAPAEAAAAPDPWRQLDRGEDPTISSG